MIKFTAGRYLPRRAHPDDAGTDLPLATDIVVPAGEHRQVGTGIHVAIPTGHVGLIHVRSSTGIKRHLVLSNGTGVIDSGYTGEILLSLHNTGRRVQRLHAGDYIAQLVILVAVLLAVRDQEWLHSAGFAAATVAQTVVLQAGQIAGYARARHEIYPGGAR